MSVRVLITGITGQDGAYLAKFLLERGCQVFGGVRHTSSLSTWRLHELGIADDVTLVGFDLIDMANVQRVVEDVAPDEIYNLAGASPVQLSFLQPINTAELNAIGTLRILESIRKVNAKARFYQASTSEMFGDAVSNYQNEETPLSPKSPYAVAKTFSHYSTKNYRDGFNLFACSGILFNHESPLRGTEFVTRKITRGLARIKYGLQDVIEVGNLNSDRDWGYAGDYVAAMWLMLQQDKPDDYVIATGRTRSVRQFAEMSAAAIGMKIEWVGTGENEKGIDSTTGRTIIRVDSKLWRPLDLARLCGDASKARTRLGWKNDIGLERLVELMIEADVNRAKAECSGIGIRVVGQ